MHPLASLHKARQVVAIALDRLGDYLELARIEMKLQGREIGLQVAGVLAAAVFALLASLFVGIAVIVSFWDSEHRALAAWLVVALYLAAAGGGLALARRHAGRGAVLTTLREEIRRDVNLVRESL